VVAHKRSDLRGLPRQYSVYSFVGRRAVSELETAACAIIFLLVYRVFRCASSIASDRAVRLPAARGVPSYPRKPDNAPRGSADLHSSPARSPPQFDHAMVRCRITGRGWKQKDFRRPSRPPRAIAHHFLQKGHGVRTTPCAGTTAEARRRSTPARQPVAGRTFCH